METMLYIALTYKAVEKFSSDRFLQSYENDISGLLCSILRLSVMDDAMLDKWQHPQIILVKTKRGIIFCTDDSQKNTGLVFDLTSFHGFTDKQDNRTIINIFQKTVKYAVRYFEGYPLASCERVIPDTNLALVYPNPFVATHNVEKIVIDRNGSKNSQKKELNFLLVFEFCTSSKQKPSYTVLNKFHDDIQGVDFKSFSKDCQKPELVNISQIDLDGHQLTVDEKIGYDNWKYYLTDVQKSFVLSLINGPERLTGAAGTGKTLCLILRSIFILKHYKEQNEEYHIIFITHSKSTKERIIDIFRANCKDYTDFEESETKPMQSILITTLQEWSANHLGTNSITDQEYLDKDAATSKELQYYYIEEAYSKIKSEYWDQSFSAICSPEFKHFIENTSQETIVEILQQEIAVLIKGRATGEYETYKQIPRPKNSLPLKVDADYKFTYSVYNWYQNALMKVGQYDSDDITLTALGQVRTPIWNRRRINEGYDAMLVDETHLFNINELSVFHFMNKPTENKPLNIVYAIDRSQANGDWGTDDMSIATAYGIEGKPVEKNFNTVFRSSPDIVNLAFNILSSGATLFTFENPLDYAAFDFVSADEIKSVRPSYSLVQGDAESIVKAVEWAERYCDEKHVSKSKVIFIPTSENLIAEFEKNMQKNHKGYETLKSRSDVKTIKKAEAGGKFLIGGIDYVGGLEFDAVVMVGVDDGRVPPVSSNEKEAFHFMNYAWHSRMYVAVTRARYAVKLYGDAARGISQMLYSAIYTEILDYDGPTFE